MNLSRKIKSIGSVCAVLMNLCTPAAWANCEMGEQGKVVEIKVTSCEEIVAERNADVQKFAKGQSDLYTGALVKSDLGLVTMYPSKEKNPCEEFRKNSLVKKKAYSTCCDTGRWGKCVFGGNFLGNIDGLAINTFQ
jgi:hypothetical protein